MTFRILLKRDQNKTQSETRMLNARMIYIVVQIKAYNRNVG